MWVHDSFGYSIQKDIKTFLGYVRNDVRKNCVRCVKYECIFGKRYKTLVEEKPSMMEILGLKPEFWGFDNISFFLFECIVRKSGVVVYGYAA
jgi:hypothetical protein